MYLNIYHRYNIKYFDKNHFTQRNVIGEESNRYTALSIPSTFLVSRGGYTTSLFSHPFGNSHNFFFARIRTHMKRT